jgi:FkbH-like protein
MMENLKYSEILKQNKLLKDKVTGDPFKVFILSNVTVNPFKEIAEYNLLLNGINPSVEIGNFDNIVQDSAKGSDANMVIIFYDVLNIIDSISVFFEDIDDESFEQIEKRICAEIDLIFSNLKETPCVIFNTFSSFAFPAGFLQQTKLEHFVLKLNNYLEKTKLRNISLVDVSKIIAGIGIRQSFDVRFYHSSKAPYTLLFFKKYISAIEPVIFRITGKLKKAIIFDCDNTLWKGIIGEDGFDKIDMSPASPQGKAFFEVQRIAKFLSKKGVIIGICSKNNMQDVEEVITNHSDMLLKNEHIVIKKINWTDKVTNLREIAKVLNIGTDSLVFVDDSSFEINLVKEQLPEVVTIQVPSTNYDYPALLMEYVYKYFNLNSGEEDRKRTETYKQQFQRQNESVHYQTIDEYLASLEIRLEITRDDRNHIPRISQLTQKTNQFNLTTIRYTEGQIEKFMEDDNSYLFSVSVRDKFGDSGLTAVCIITGDESGRLNARVDTLLMSCRVIGRNIEVFFMDYILVFLREKGYQAVYASYSPTAKNTQVEAFYDKMGFVPDKSEKGIKYYSLQLHQYLKKDIDYIKAEVKHYS